MFLRNSRFVSSIAAKFNAAKASGTAARDPFAGAASPSHKQRRLELRPFRKSTTTALILAFRNNDWR